jgi:hypothetical protein
MGEKLFRPYHNDPKEEAHVWIRWRKKPDEGIEYEVEVDVGLAIWLMIQLVLAVHYLTNVVIVA